MARRTCCALSDLTPMLLHDTTRRDTAPCTQAELKDDFVSKVLKMLDIPTEVWEAVQHEPPPQPPQSPQPPQPPQQLQPPKQPS